MTGVSLMPGHSSFTYIEFLALRSVIVLFIQRGAILSQEYRREGTSAWDALPQRIRDKVPEPLRPRAKKPPDNDNDWVLIGANREEQDKERDRKPSENVVHVLD